jgi:hypothetical protein
MFMLKSCAKGFILYTITTMGSYVVKKGLISSSVNEVKVHFWGKLINIASKVYYGAENIFAWIGGRRSKQYELKQIIRTVSTNNWISIYLHACVL